MDDISRTKATLFLEAKGIPSPEQIYLKLDKTGLDKIDRLMDGDITSNEKNYFFEHFNRFVELVPDWNQTRDVVSSSGRKRKADSQDDGEIHLFWTQFDTEQCERIMVIRKQTSGLCYLHAPVVMEHYLIAIATAGENSSTYDIGKYEAHVLTGDCLVNFLLKDEGGSSQNTLKELCGLTEVDTKHFHIPDKEDDLIYSNTCQIIFERVAQSPALISTFRVYPEFHQTDAVSFSCIPQQDVTMTRIPMHSMVLIGARKTTSGDYFFLLQNWWEGRYFIEVSGEYLHHCQAEITFVKKAITRKRELATLLCDALYAETSADASETFYEYEGKIAGENVF